MPPKGWKKKQAGRANQEADTRAHQERSQAIKIGLPIASGRLNLANVRRGWLVLRCAFRFAFMLVSLRRSRSHSALIRAIRNSDGKLPSVYKAKQFGASGHHTFNSVDARKLVRAQNDCAVAVADSKLAGTELRVAEKRLHKEQRATPDLQKRLDDLVQERKDESKVNRREYKSKWENAKRTSYIVEHILPGLRLALAQKVETTRAETLKLVRKHIHQVRYAFESWAFICGLLPCSIASRTQGNSRSSTSKARPT